MLEEFRSDVAVSVVFWAPCLFSLCFVLHYLATTLTLTSRRSRGLLFWLDFGFVGALYALCTRHIVGMVEDDMTRGGLRSFGEWLATSTPAHRQHSLVFEAYVVTSNKEECWWWSSQLYLFAVTLVTFLAVESRSRFTGSILGNSGSSHPVESRGLNYAMVVALSFMWLGFGFGLAASLPLFLSGVYLLHRRQEEEAAPRVVLAARAPGSVCSFSLPLALTLLALLSSSLMPSLAARVGWGDDASLLAFDANLAAGHLLCAALVVVLCTLPQAYYAVPTTYAVLAGGALVSHATNTAHLLLHSATPGLSVWQAAAAYSHEQTLVCYDLLFVTLECVALVLATERSVGAKVAFACLSPVLSVSVTFPCWLLWREVSSAPGCELANSKED